MENSPLRNGPLVCCKGSQSRTAFPTDHQPKSEGNSADLQGIPRLPVDWPRRCACWPAFVLAAHDRVAAGVLNLHCRPFASTKVSESTSAPFVPWEFRSRRANFMSE